MIDQIKLDKLCKRLRSSSYTTESLAADAIDQLRDQIRLLEYALKDLLNDTQHTTHNCKDFDCPVNRAKKLLNNKK